LIDDDRLLSRVRVLGDAFRVGLERFREAERLGDVRARGLMVGVDLPPAREGEAPKLVAGALSERIVLNATGPSTLRFLPPLVIDESDVERVLAFLEGAL
jgi:4-aminobutyrate aminotransferase-like enzyme